MINIKDSPFNAAGDGLTDDTAAILAAASVAKTNRSTLYVPAGTYRCDTINVEVPIIGDGIGQSILKALDGGGKSSVLNFPDGVRDVQMQKLSLDGNRGKLGAISSIVNGCLRVGGVSGLSIEDCELVNSDFAGAWIGSNGFPPRNITFYRCKIHDNGGAGDPSSSNNGVGVFTGGTQIPDALSFLDCLFQENHNTILNPNDSTGLNLIGTNIQISGNRFVNNFNSNGAQVSVTDGGDGSKFINLIIEGNQILWSGGFGNDRTDGIEIDGRGFVVSGNIINGVRMSGTSVNGSGGAGGGVISSNYIGGVQSGGAGILLYGNANDPSSDIAITGNHVAGATYGVALNQYNDRITVVGNNFSTCDHPWNMMPPSTRKVLFASNLTK